MKGTEITCEALEGMGFVKDFEVYRFCYPYARDRGWIEVIIERKNVSVCANAEWNGFIEVPVATLPQLRRLIRSLFGDDALPRRELSSITDEELLRLFYMCYSKLQEGGVGLTISSKEIKAKGRVTENMVQITKRGEILSAEDDYRWGKVPALAYDYLISVLDFHLPSFHEAAHNAN